MTTESSARPLRIGIVTDSMHERIVNGEVRIANGGVGVYIYQLIRHLLTVDSVNEYFLIRFGRGFLDVYQNPRAHNVFMPARKIDRALALLGGPYSRPVREFNLDLIHFPNLFGGSSLPVSIRQVVTLQDLTPLLFPSMHPRHRVWASRILTRRTLRRANRIIVPSRATGRDLVAANLASDDRIVCIPHGINPIFQPTEATSELAGRHQITNPFILTVGVLEPRKNHPMLLEVIRALHRRGHRLELIIIGRPGWRWKNPLTMAKYRDLRPWVKVLTDVPDRDLVEFYNRAELFIYPSLYEGFGLPILEAMACGTPVIASSVSSMPEVGGPAALLADPADPREFVSQALRLLEDKDMRRQVVDAGLRHAHQFTWAAAARATLAVYRSVCDSAPENALPGPPQSRAQ
ncbi:glycosyltransferase family 4 protein [Candidatus Binatus sp.]|uniref:glycosyltransferase family 4 protein n=1 Tax=Candidatus Binatus sp. TaxID=2811406 RepID=UPI003C4B99C0